ncbi:hypothetical protein [Helicobacter pylori]|uniref:hypothetical protein n=1 Tax=Helicobacter pylori TaxID=210 RepID=UPI001E46A270|nr:hypothetical protein [Helicobacter pylori]
MDSTYIKHYLDGINLLDMHLSLPANQITPPPPPEIENACDLGFGLGVDLIYHYAKDLGNLKSPGENIQSSLWFFKDLLDLPVLEDFKNIQLQSQFNNILSSNAKYLVHEYLNQSYESFDLAKLAAKLRKPNCNLQARLILLGC